MHTLLANHSSYPRIGDTKHAQRLRRAYADRERGKMSQGEFEHVEHVVLEEILREQATAQLDWATDGQITWADPVSHLAERLDGVRLNGLLRFLDTNTYFRQPVIEAKLRRRRPLVTQEYQRACAACPLPIKPVLTGPYTLARQSLIATTAYRNAPALAADLSTILADEVHDLVAAGARLVQIDEPLILQHPEDIRLLRELLEPLQNATGDAAQLAVATYFGDAEPLYAQLNSLPADIVALDCSESPRLLDAVAQTGSSKVLAFGLINGRSTRLENPDHVAGTLERLLHRYVHDTVYLQPSCGLEHLPRDRARAKLNLLPAIRKVIAGTTHGTR